MGGPARVAFETALAGRAELVVRPGGALVCYAPGAPRRRLLELDRRDMPTAELMWGPSGDLAWARCRMADGRLVGIEPGAGIHPAWGRSDRLWLMADRPEWAPCQLLTVFASVNWRRPAEIPALAEPARLPPGAGTAALNLLAGVMEDSGIERVGYHGPYPSESLFTALLESFRCDPAAGAPLQAFAAGEPLDWLPASHERHHVAEGVCVQLRGEIDKVVLDGAAFYRRDWPGIFRREPRVVRADGDRVVCSLWALGQSIEDRLVLDRTGTVLERPPPRPDSRFPTPMPPVWASGLAELIARESSAILARPVAEALAAAALEWGPVPGDLLAVDGPRLRISRALRDVGTAWVRAAPSADARGERAVLMALEVARLVAPTIRLRAQQHLAALPEVEQRRRWEKAEAASPPALTESAGRLIALIASGAA